MRYGVRRVAGVVALGLLALVAAAADEPAKDKDQGKDKPEFKLTAAEKQILAWTNEVRAKKDLPPLTIQPELTEAARKHSQNMAKQGKLAHELDGKSPTDRARAAGYKGGGVGENCATGQGITVRGLFDTWMKSEPHRANILSDRYATIGIGLGRNAQGELYATQVFGLKK